MPFLSLLLGIEEVPLNSGYVEVYKMARMMTKDEFQFKVTAKTEQRILADSSKEAEELMKEMIRKGEISFYVSSERVT
jgi:hypothetical protein